MKERRASQPITTGYASQDSFSFLTTIEMNERLTECKRCGGVVVDKEGQVVKYPKLERLEIYL
jgi:hypothetical protein